MSYISVGVTFKLKLNLLRSCMRIGVTVKLNFYLSRRYIPVRYVYLSRSYISIFHTFMLLYIRSYGGIVTRVHAYQVSILGSVSVVTGFYFPTSGPGLKLASLNEQQIIFRFSGKRRWV